MADRVWYEDEPLAVEVRERPTASVADVFLRRGIRQVEDEDGGTRWEAEELTLSGNYDAAWAEASAEAIWAAHDASSVTVEERLDAVEAAVGEIAGVVYGD